MLNKAMMGESPGDSIPGRRPATLCSWRIPPGGRRRRRRGEGWSLNNLPSEREKYAEERCVCAVDDALVCVFVLEPERHKQTGRGGPQSVPLPLLSPETNPLKTNSVPPPQKDRKQQQE